jgi:hypothetical protein
MLSARGAILLIVMLRIGIVNDLAVGPRWLAPDPLVRITFMWICRFSNVVGSEIDKTNNK